MADGIKYPTDDHVHADAGYAPPPYVDPATARRAELQAELDQINESLKPEPTPEEKAKALQAEIDALGTPTTTASWQTALTTTEQEAELQAKIDALRTGNVGGGTGNIPGA